MYSEIDEVLPPEGVAHLSLAIANDGFSTSIYYKLFFLVIENKETGQRFSFPPINSPDIREWHPDDSIEETLEFNVASANPPPGKYNVYLEITDINFIHRPEYNIVFANKGMEEPNTRINNLGISFTIE